MPMIYQPVLGIWRMMILEKPIVSEKSDSESSTNTMELFRLWRIPFNDDITPGKLVIALRERIKELNCLYGMTKLAERHSDSIELFLKDLVNFLPFSWQYPDIACTRIIFEEKTYKSKNFKVTKWRQSSRILMYNEPVGEVSIFYLEESPPADEGPFLKEERVLLDALAERIGQTAVRVATEKELQEMNEKLTLERKALQDANAAIRAVLERIEEEKKEVYMDIQANVDKIIMPILHALSFDLPVPKRKYAEVLRSSLEEIISPFVNRLSKNHLSLTPTEVNICNMIKSGLRTKEIASIRNVSEATINRHREHIRRKLNICNSDINLITYLQSISK
jgi:DNA-binding CsgD family transcriptional regulator